jgi:hypothetical protein
MSRSPPILKRMLFEILLDSNTTLLTVNSIITLFIICSFHSLTSALQNGKV